MKQKHTFYQRESKNKLSLRTAPLTTIILLESLTIQQQQQQTLDIVDYFAPVAETHGNIGRFRTDTVVRAVMFFSICSFIFLFFVRFLHFHFSRFFFFSIFYMTLITENVVEKFPLLIK